MSRASRKPCFTFSSVPLEAAILVLDDAVALVARAVQLAEHDPQSTSPRPGMRGICQPMPIEKMPRSYSPSRSIIRSFAWIVQDVRPELR